MADKGGGQAERKVIEVEQSGRAFRFAFYLRPDEPTGPGRARWLDVGWDGQTYPVRMRAALTDAGEVLCTTLILGMPSEDVGEPTAHVTARSLRDVPLNDVLLCLNRMRAARGRIARPGGGPLPSVDEELERRRTGLPGPMPDWTFTLSEIIFGRDATPYQASRIHPGRRGLPREHFEAIAKAYNEILARNPKSPMRELAEQQHYSLAQVRRWVKRAEELGFKVNRPHRGKPTEGGTP